MKNCQAYIMVWSELKNELMVRPLASALVK